MILHNRPLPPRVTIDDHRLKLIILKFVFTPDKLLPSRRVIGVHFRIILNPYRWAHHASIQTLWADIDDLDWINNLLRLTIPSENDRIVVKSRAMVRLRLAMLIIRG